MPRYPWPPRIAICVLGKTDTDIFAADDAQLLMRLKRRVMATGCELKQQMWITSKGKRVFIDLYLEPLRDMHHNIIGVGVATVDLTERQEIAEELQITLKRFYSILSNLHSGILLVTDEDQVEFANQAFCDCFGLGDFPADLMKLTVSEIVEKIRKVYAEPEKAMARILKILEKDQLVKNEEVALSNNRTLLRDFVPLRLDDKQKGRLWIHLDITDRKQAAEALREINRRKDEFLATLGHELRNPLVPIRNAAHILTARSFSDPELVRLCGIIESQVGHMVRLVNDLLDISRIERGKIELQKEKVDIVQVLARVAEACRPLFDEKKQDLRVALPKRTLVLSGDSVRLEQVVGNLLNNASKFTPPGGTIHLSAVLQNASIVVRVRDEGVGMAPETLQNAFELFFQANTPGKRSQGGLGIGLTLVKRLVELHGGTVTASSAGLDQGSEFSLALPVKDFSLVKPARLKKTIRQKPASGKHILLIDDDQSVLKSMEMLLHAYGFRVSLAADGETGVDQALALRPDIALVDLGLPGLNGQETAARIRKALGKNIFLIALSGYAQKQNKTSAGAQGFDKYFIKPVNPDELIQTLGGVKIGKAGAKIGKGKTKTAKSKPTRG
jgi:PAS domain S-box-containing protein